MNGPDIVARSLSVPFMIDQYGNPLQYHSQSDHHSKIACWGIMFDLLHQSAVLQSHVASGKVVFGVNHEMSDFRTGRKKDLDLVIARPAAVDVGSQRSFASLVRSYGIALTARQSLELNSLPQLYSGPVGSVLLALEAKACMTEHMKARPRLYDELNSSHLTIHGSAEQAIAAAFVMVNASTTFISTGRNKFSFADKPPVITRHRQPRAAERVIEKIQELPRRTRAAEEGFDALGIVVVDCQNDGSPIGLVAGPPAPSTGSVYHYHQMILRIRQKYEVLFAGI